MRQTPEFPRREPALHLRLMMVLAFHLGAHLPDIARILLFLLLPFCQRGPALERAQVVDEKLSIEMVDLMLKAPSKQRVGRRFEWIPILIERANGDFRRALDIAVNVGDRQASLFRLLDRAIP